MYRNLRVGVIAPCHDEASRIGNVVRRVKEWGGADVVLVVDDGSVDGSWEVARGAGAEVLRLEERSGVGAALRAGFFSLHDRVDAIVVMAGNDKDEPLEIPRLLAPLAEGRAVFVQGSRYAKGGAALGAMPLYRRFATRLHPFLFRLATGKRVTESTNGFRAFLSSVLLDGRLNLGRFDGYELEPYFYSRVVRLGYETCEVPVTKTYPASGPYTKIQVRDWWAILRPLLQP